MKTQTEGNNRIPRVVLLDHAKASPAYPATSCSLQGSAIGYLGQGHSIWAVAGKLTEGAELVWGHAHGDEALYVLDGCLELAGKTCSSHGSIVIEANVPASVRAIAPTTILHCGSLDSQQPPSDGPFGPPSQTGQLARVILEEESTHINHVASDGVTYSMRFYADGTSPTSRLALFWVSTDGASEAPIHSHSQDEIIHVVSGELHIGKLRIGPGMSIAIKANQRYGFTSPGPVAFMNYRRDVSYVVMDQKPPELETVAMLTSERAAQELFSLV